MTQTTNTKNQRHIWIAVLLSLIMPGLGQIYCGKLARGLVFTFLNFLPLPVTIGLFAMSTSSLLMPAVIAMILLAGLIQLTAIIDSAFLAHNAKEYVLKDYNKPVVYVLLLVLITTGSVGSAFYLREQLLEAFRVPTASNYPTILPGDRFIANKIAYKSTDPKRGDLIVFVNPEDRRINYINRVIAVAGETVEIKNSELYVNDQKLQRQKLPQSTLDDIRIQVRDKPLEGDVYEETNGDAKYKIFLAGHRPPGYFAKMTVPKHHCFVLGDNRNHSKDSRYFGPVLLATVKGRADYLYFPAKDWSRFGKIR
ncbi:MAG: signal peptidase I [Planctomycetes bacterium]|nr:signal peptidase I [Planctomycetota bacterium]